MILDFYKKYFIMFNNFIFILFFINLLLLYFNLFFIFFVKNPVYSIIFLMLSFLNISIFLLYLGIEFFAILILIIYVGAISILFLFVMMLIDIKDILLMKKRLFIQKNIILFYFILILFFLFFLGAVTHFLDTWISFVDWYNISFFLKSDLLNLGFILFNFYYLPFLQSGIILLIAMVGCISLVIDENFVSKKQNLLQQIVRNSKKNLILNV